MRERENFKVGKGDYCIMDEKKDGVCRVLMISSEAAPYAKSGGMGDVCGSLPKELKQLGTEIRLVLPKYQRIREEELTYLGEFQVSLSWRIQTAKIYYAQGEVPTYFIANDMYFDRENLYGYADDNERFAFFCKAALDMLSMLDYYPDVIHCNDWQTGPVCMYLQEMYKKIIYYSSIKTLFTIHNLQYQGNFDKETMEMLGVPYECYANGNVEFYGNVSYMKMGLVYADRISTVSETYANEIQTQEYGYGMDGVLRSRKNVLRGILNGIDYSKNNPETDNRIDYNFNIKTIDTKKKNKINLQKQLGLEEKDIPMISMITRLADQKGLDILAQSMEELLRENIQFVLLGTGEQQYQNLFLQVAQRYSRQVSANFIFDDTLAQKIYASSDMFLMPSLFEPCGLGQIFSLRYGTVPIVRKTGGLADTIQHYDMNTKTGNGFVFEVYDKEGLLWGVREALRVYAMGKEQWEHVVKNAMSSNYSWTKSAQKYIELYNELCFSDKR